MALEVSGINKPIFPLLDLNVENLKQMENEKKKDLLKRLIIQVCLLKDF
jgi:hypothetical protein